MEGGEHAHAHGGRERRSHQGDDDPLGQHHLGQLAIDGSLQFKVEDHAVGLASRLRDSLALALVEAIDCGIVAGFASLNEALIKDLAGRCVGRPIVLDIATAIAGQADVDVAIGISGAPLHESLLDEMFQIAVCLTGVAVIAVLDQILGLNCAKSSDIGEGLYLGVAKVIGAFACRMIPFFQLWVSS